MHKFDVGFLQVLNLEKCFLLLVCLLSLLPIFPEIILIRIRSNKYFFGSENKIRHGDIRIENIFLWFEVQPWM